ncbi:MAG: Crp/Fnr family transcriptional regulator [Crocinitomicaceae bacterium]
MKPVENTACLTCKARSKSIFSSCSFEVLANLDEMKTCQVYQKGEELFQMGHHPKGIFCVISGKIKVYQKGFDGKEQIVHLISAGNIMGHRALFGDDTYSCSAIALEECKVCFLPKSKFYDMISKDGKLTFKIAQLLAHELKEAEEIITSTAQQPVMERVAKMLIVLQKQYGFLADEATLNIEMKRDDFANMVGSTRETVTRYLYKLKKDGLIDIIGKKIKILDYNKLTTLSKEG